jgi:hypothetical protein
MSRPFLIVTGAGRSGTSAVARVLHESGVRMGDHQGIASRINPVGFYEDVDVRNLNDQLLEHVGLADTSRPQRWPSRARVVAAARGRRDEMAALAARAADGWKDPRFSITLEAWLPLLPSRPKVIVCLRSPEAYAESAVQVYGLIEPAAAMRQWARHYHRLLTLIEAHGLEAACVEYDLLVDNPSETVDGLAAFVGRPLRAAYVEASLRRERGGVPGRYRRLYERVRTLGGPLTAPPSTAPARHGRAHSGRRQPPASRRAARSR